MIRKRLTARMQVAGDDTPYPGNVNQPGKVDPDRAKYDNYKEEIGWELQDKRTDWKANPRDEVGFGIPKVAAVYATAQQAVRLATLFLGDKANDDHIEAQARDFMRLGARRIQAALKRFNDTATLYAEDEAANPNDAVQPVSPEQADLQKVDRNAPVTAEAAPKTAPKTAEDQDGDGKDQSKNDFPGPAPEAKVEDVKKPVTAEDDAAGATGATGAAAAAPKTAEEAPKTEDKKDETVEATDDKDEDDKPMTADEDGGPAIEMEDLDDDVPADETEDEELTGVFETAEDDEKAVVSASSKKRKAGAKTLGGQPKVAAVQGSDDLAGIWNDAPDVSDVFGN